MEREVEGSKSLRIAVNIRRKGKEISAMENRICQDTEIIIFFLISRKYSRLWQTEDFEVRRGDAELNQNIAFLHEMKFELFFSFLVSLKYYSSLVEKYMVIYDLHKCFLKWASSALIWVSV